VDSRGQIRSKRPEEASAVPPPRRIYGPTRV
jgi:hypothetical protein